MSKDQYELKNEVDLTDQINNKIEESLNLLFMNNLISQKNKFYSLSEKPKYIFKAWIQSKLMDLVGILNI